MILEHTNYRSFLKSVLADRISSNPSYSLRAFARDLSMTPALLSNVFNGKKNFSFSTALGVAQKLRLDPTETEYFTLLVQYEATKNLKARDLLLQKLNQFNQKRSVHNLDVDTFKMISDWYHIPILAMADLTDVELAPKKISEQLGISQLEATVALERLIRLELLVKNEKGRLVRTHNNSVFQSETVNQNIRNFHKQMLQKAISAAESKDQTEKFFGSETLAIASEDVPAAKKMINQFFDRFVETLVRRKKKDHVYHIDVQFFNLTNGGNEK